MLKEDIITGNAFRDICDDYIDDDKPYISLENKPKIIFLKTDWIEIFKEKVLPKIDYQFKLVTHNADRPAPSGNFDLLDDKRLIKWFGMNCNAAHPKLQPIPIGIANEKWPHGDKNTLLDIINSNICIEKLVYANFDISTNYKERSRISQLLNEKQFVDYDRQKHSFKTYLQTLKTYKYVISPPGNSIDCHRVWEALYLGVIPIIEANNTMSYFYDLPILVVDSFSELTVELLENQYTILTTRNKSKKLFSHYSNMIKT